MNYYIMIIWLLVGARMNAFDSYDRYKAASAYRSGDFATAQSLYEKLYVNSQSDLEIVYNYGKASYALGEFEKAEALFQNVLDSQSVSDRLKQQTHFDIANTLVREKQYEDALSHYEAVCAIDPDHKESREMIEQIKKILEQQQQQNQNQQQQGENKQSQQNDTKNQQCDKNNQQSDSENKDESQSGDSENNSDQKNESGEPNQQQKSDNQSRNDRSDEQSGDDESQSENQQSPNDSQKNDSGKSQSGDQPQQSPSDQGGQSGNDHDAQRDFENNVTPNKGGQRGNENQRNQSDKQSLGQLPQGVDGSANRNNQQNDSKGGKPQHQQPSQKNESGNSSQQDMTTGGQAQEFDDMEEDPLSEAEHQLIRVLQKEETEALKDLVNAHIKGMPHNAGQKNW